MSSILHITMLSCTFLLGPPDAPTITTQDKGIQVESLWVKWTPPIDNGGSNITGYRVIVLQDGKVETNKTTTSDKLQYFVDKGLTKSTYYTLRVSALNKVFEGMADEKNVITKYPGEKSYLTLMILH